MVEVLLPLGILLFLLVIGVPVAYALFISGSAGLILVGPGNTGTIVYSIVYAQASSFVLTTIPMFILMAMFLDESQLTEYLFEAINRWVCNIKGGLALATTVANGGMAALSGSSTATAAAMSQIAVPEMQKRGYDDRLSLGTVAAGGTFAVTLPPSVALIIYGILTETSIADLFVAGIIPGLLTLIGYAIIIYLWALKNPNILGEMQESFTFAERIESLKPVWPAIIIILLVLGGIYLGVVTPTEAGALGAAGSLVVGYTAADLSNRGILTSLQRATETTTMIFMIIIGAIVFGRYMAFAGVTETFIEFVTSFSSNPWIILLMIMAAYIMLGTVMDQLAILILTLPLTFPLIIELGFGAIFFGILIAKTIEVGLVTPPLGLNVYVATGTIDEDVWVGFKGAVMFIPVDIIVILLIMEYPWILTIL